MGDSLQFFEWLFIRSNKSLILMHSLLLLRFLMTMFLESITYYQVIVHSLKIFLPFFQAHVAESAIAEHCSTYALSDSKEDP